MEMGSQGGPRNPQGWKIVLQGSRRDGSKCCGTPAGWKNILRDSSRNVAILNFYYGAPPTSESNIHFFQVQNFECMLNYNNSYANWNISFG